MRVVCVRPLNVWFDKYYSTTITITITMTIVTRSAVRQRRGERRNGPADAQIESSVAQSPAELPGDTTLTQTIGDGMFDLDPTRRSHLLWSPEAFRVYLNHQLKTPHPRLSKFAHVWHDYRVFCGVGDHVLDVRDLSCVHYSCVLQACIYYCDQGFGHGPGQIGHEDMLFVARFITPRVVKEMCSRSESGVLLMKTTINKLMKVIQYSRSAVATSDQAYTNALVAAQHIAIIRDSIPVDAWGDAAPLMHPRDPAAGIDDTVVLLTQLW